MTEKKYSLEDADKILKRRECMEDGHDLEQEMFRNGDGISIRVIISCFRCGERFIGEGWEKPA